MSRAPILAIVQARMGSSRFPGKVLAAFEDSTVLQCIFRRLSAVDHPLKICVATSDRADDDAVEMTCRDEGISVFRGPAEDVLARFIACRSAVSPASELILRICADRPLLCPSLVDEVIAAYDELGQPDYLTNNLTASYPDGLDVELARASALEIAAREATDPYDREHVTPFIYRRPQRFSLEEIMCPFGNFCHINVALDTQEDYLRLCRLRDALPLVFDFEDLLNAAAVLPEFVR